MELFHDPAAAQAWCEDARSRGHDLGFVPTMGALHEGHLSLIRRSAQENARTVVSVFVNPLQFDEAADFESYPQDLDKDASLAGDAGADLVFSGRLDQFFEGELNAAGELPTEHLRNPGPAALGLEGEHRQGHFAGVATIVARLFRFAAPSRAYFGAKDYQQSLVVRSCCDDKGRPDVIVCPTLRESSGLAMSSRNKRLNGAEREHALHLVVALRAAHAAWEAGARDAAELEGVLAASLAPAVDTGEIELEYAAIRDPEQWSATRPDGCLTSAVALLAARVGTVRLIDNARLDQVPFGVGGVL
jgi:pantoate--beta-alanine ligase